MTSFIPSLTLPPWVFLHPASSILLPLAIGTGVGYTVRPRDTQKTYASLHQPPFCPPARVFGPAWSLIYGLMGYAAYRAVSTGLTPFKPASVLTATKHGATLYTIQLGLNFIWMPLFFGARRPIEAAVDIVALTGTVGYMTYLWGKVDKVAAWCLVPYLGWLGFATYLTIGVGCLNNWDLRDRTLEAPPSSAPEGTK